MSDELRAESERGYVSIRRSDRGRGWTVAARVGDTAEQLREAYENARAIEQLLEADDSKIGGSRAQTRAVAKPHG